jgi:predicted O-methyltransferase YrrM
MPITDSTKKPTISVFNPSVGKNEEWICESDDYAKFLTDRMPALLKKRIKGKVLDFCIADNQWTEQSIVAEFGVFRGAGVTKMAEARPELTVYGFDSFEGFQEDWVDPSSGETWSPKGGMSTGGALPVVPKNVELVKGWFDVSLPMFLKTDKRNFDFIHIDCDTYEATKCMFDLIHHRIEKGCVIVFDELFMGGEAKAFHEFCHTHKRSFEWIGYGANNGCETGYTCSELCGKEVWDSMSRKDKFVTWMMLKTMPLKFKMEDGGMVSAAAVRML